MSNQQNIKAFTMKKLIVLGLLAFFGSGKNLFSQTTTDSTTLAKKYQAKPPATQPFGKDAFGSSEKTTLRWLGMAGFFINSRGTTLMVDPLLKGFDMPIMIDFPIKTEEVPHLDAVLVTHADNDHYSVPTNRDLAGVTKGFHSTIYVDSLMTNEGFPSHGYNIGDEFQVGSVHVKLTAADHAYQNFFPGMSDRFFKDEDACGFWITTSDGIIWAPGDSRLMPEHLQYPEPDAILFDFSDSEWHFTLEGAIKIANAYPNTPLLLNHWGSVDAPDFAPFNANPEDLYGTVVNPERIILLAPGEAFELHPLKNKKTGS
jgi:L-ascorbate metabolism protein UlaG (beta-lactamase superfamily)